MRRYEHVEGSEAGFTLVEVLVAIVLASLLGGTMLAALISSAQAGRVVRNQHDIAQEATVVLNRMGRELREAYAIQSVTNASGSGATYDPAGNVEITFDVDFNNNGTIEPDAADPERLTYRFNRATHQVLLLASTYNTPIIAGGVNDMQLFFRGRDNDWTTYDTTAKGGNGDGLLNGFELKRLDTVEIRLVMRTASNTQTLDTSVNLRNLTS